MTKAPYTLTFVISEGQVVMHADANGLDALIKTLRVLRKKISEGECEHDHYFADVPGDGLLTTSIGNEIGEAAHHLKLCGWTDEWSHKNGFQPKNFNDSSQPTGG